MPSAPSLRLATLLRVVGALVAAFLVLAPAAPARAHNHLVDSDPARDATLKAPPTNVTLEFLERLNPAYTTIVVTDAEQRRVPTSDPAVSGARVTVTFTQPLADGTYTVAYRIVSTDGHPVQGSYSFTVASGAEPAETVPAGDSSAPAAPSSAPAATSSAPAAASASPVGGVAASDGPDTATVTAVAVVLIALAVAGGGYLVWRRRSGRA